MSSPFFIVRIQQNVCEYFGISMDKMLGKTRKQEIVIPRHIAIYLVKKYTDLSLNNIGNRFGGRDHSTIIHALKNVEEIKEQNPVLKKDIKNIEEDLVDISKSLLTSKYY